MLGWEACSEKCLVDDDDEWLVSRRQRPLRTRHARGRREKEEKKRDLGISPHPVATSTTSVIEEGAALCNIFAAATTTREPRREGEQAATASKSPAEEEEEEEDEGARMPRSHALYPLWKRPRYRRRHRTAERDPRLRANGRPSGICLPNVLLRPAKVSTWDRADPAKPSEGAVHDEAVPIDTSIPVRPTEPNNWEEAFLETFPAGSTHRSRCPLIYFTLASN